MPHLAPISTNGRRLKIFLAEDNQADIYLVEMALREHGIQFILTSTFDGEDAIRRIKDFNGSDCPDIALLDQNLPRVSGEQVMAAIRLHEHCKTIPIVLMSSSDTCHEQEIVTKFGATFFRKAANLDAFLELGAMINHLCP